MKRLLPILFLVLFAGTARAALQFGPYLQAMAPDVMLVCAYLEAQDRYTVQLRYEGNETREASLVAERQPACVSFDGLQPDVQYEYAITVNGQTLTPEPWPSFVTASSRRTTLVIYGDTRSGDDSFDLAHREVVQSLRESVVPDAIVHTGDFIEKGDDLSLWANFFHLEQSVLATAPLYPAIGQSDQPDALMRRLFPLLQGDGWYSFDRGNAHVAVLDVWESSSQPAAQTAPEGAQAQWLRRDLAQARANGSRYLFVVMHEPVYEVTGKTPAAIRRTFQPIFEAFQVNAVFSGAHFFSHKVHNGVHYFTNGGGGAALNTEKPQEGTFRYYNAIHHFLLIEADDYGAGVRAINSFGESFYEVPLTESATHLDEAKAATFIRSYAHGPQTAALTVFFAPHCDECNELEELLPAMAAELKCTILATYRSVDDAQNQAMLAALTDRDGPTPIVALGNTVLVGMEEVETRLAEAVVQAATVVGEKRNIWVQWTIGVGALIAGLLLLLLIHHLRRAKEA
ncbi:MAG TPA: metallophosphoesterase [bacterium]|mgnify:CR=1 FL=1|nr:metallophosphoesterase [bacterium]